MCKLGVISQEWLKIEVKLLLSANRKSYMPRRLAQQRMTLSDLERPSHASRAISAVAECLVSCVVVHDDFAAAAGDLMLMLVVVVQYT